MTVQKSRNEFGHGDDRRMGTQQRLSYSVSAFRNPLIIRCEEYLSPPIPSGEMSERIGNKLVVNVEHTSGGARRIAHGQCIHRQSVLEQVFQFVDPLFFGHLLKNPNGKTAGSGSKTGIVMVIARPRTFFIHGIYLIERMVKTSCGLCVRASL